MEMKLWLKSLILKEQVSNNMISDKWNISKHRPYLYNTINKGIKCLPDESEWSDLEQDIVEESCRSRVGMCPTNGHVLLCVAISIELFQLSHHLKMKHKTDLEALQSFSAGKLGLLWFNLLQQHPKFLPPQ